MALTIKRAVRTQAKARIALIGPSGSGKTYSMLLMLHALAQGKRYAVIDTEHGSASKYVDITDPDTGIVFDFDVIELDSFSPDKYVEALTMLQAAGYGAIGCDSLSHAWSGKDGALELVDKAAKRTQSGNTFAAWRDVTPKHNALVEALSACRAHLVVTMRSKMEYVLEDVTDQHGRTKKQPRKIGLAPIQREGLEYEFDVVGDIDLEHRWIISKTRCPQFDGAIVEKPGAKFAETMLGWLQTGAPAPEPVKQATPAATSSAHARFSKTLDTWPGFDHWAGRLLADAPLAVLLDYADGVRGAQRASKNGNAAKWLAHLVRVEEAIKGKEPAMETGSDPAGIAGDPAEPEPPPPDEDEAHP